MSAEAEIWTFPTNPEEFDHDDRISFSKLDNKYIAVQDDGAEFEFDSDLKRWAPIVDEALIQEHQSGYGVPDDADSSRPGPGQGKKRKKDESNDREVSCARMRVGSSSSRCSHPITLPDLPL